jgi:hypothetical protein
MNNSKSIPVTIFAVLVLAAIPISIQARKIEAARGELGRLGKPVSDPGRPGGVEDRFHSSRTSVHGGAGSQRGSRGIQSLFQQHHIPDADIAAFLASSAGHQSMRWLDPGQSLTWMDQILNEEQKKTSIPWIMARWVETDYNAAATYLGQMPPSPIKDESVAHFVGRAATIDPPAAAEWTFQISDPEQRKAAIGEVIRTWSKTDPQSVDAWLLQEGHADFGP